MSSESGRDSESPSASPARDDRSSRMGREMEACAEAAGVLRINPKFSVDSYAKVIPFKDQSETDKFINALRKAGLK